MISILYACFRGNYMMNKNVTISMNIVTFWKGVRKLYQFIQVGLILVRSHRYSLCHAHYWHWRFNYYLCISYLLFNIIFSRLVNQALSILKDDEAWGFCIRSLPELFPCGLYRLFPTILYFSPVEPLTQMN